MLRYSHLNTAATFIEKFKGATPLAPYLKEQFKKDKKYGSRDRKYISHAVYCYYRLANAILNADVATTIQAGLLLVHTNLPNIFAEIKPAWHTMLENNIEITTNKKIEYLTTQHIIVDINKLFKYNNLITTTLNINDVINSYLQQPSTFFRVRANADIKNFDLKIAELEAAHIDANCYAITNNKPIDTVFAINKEVVIQDWASQQVATYLPVLNQPKISIWDVCAGAGGKSLLAIDHYQTPTTIVNVNGTDIRPSIIENYKQRMKEAGIKSYNTSVKDITTSTYLDITKKYDLAICDVPCTGSGTWARTPEMHYFFTADTIRPLITTQYLILSNTVKQMQPNTFVLYITCSIFKQENEDIIQQLLESGNRVKLIKSGIINGVATKADIMYAALLQVIG